MVSGMSFPSVSGINNTSTPAAKHTLPQIMYGRNIADPTPADTPSMIMKGADMEPSLQALLQIPSAVERMGVGYNSAVYVGVTAREAAVHTHTEAPSTEGYNTFINLHMSTSEYTTQQQLGPSSRTVVPDSRCAERLAADKGVAAAYIACIPVLPNWPIVARTICAVLFVMLAQVRQAMPPISRLPDITLWRPSLSTRNPARRVATVWPVTFRANVVYLQGTVPRGNKRARLVQENIH